MLWCLPFFFALTLPHLDLLLTPCTYAVISIFIEYNVMQQHHQ